MQLDDDVSVDHECVERLIRTLQKFPDAAVAPTLINSLTNESVYRMDHGDGVFRRIYHWLMNGKDGYREGTIQRSGSPLGIVPGDSASEWREVEWLAGGCVMHRKANLILENYFPFTGKAYCEDMIHSYLLAQKGVRLLIDSRAWCSLEVSPPLQRNWGAFLRETYDDFIVRRYYMRLSKRAPGRMYLYYLLLLFRYLYLRLVRKTGRGPALPVGASPVPRKLSE
jgi:GT2 family glycosyltransferase